MKTLEIFCGTPAYDDCIRLRTDILRRPLGLEFVPEDLVNEYENVHLAIYDHADELKGCLVFNRLNEKRLKMRQVAIAEEVQKKGYGSTLVKASEEWAKENGFEIIELNARDTAVPFYKKLDYEVSGDEFIEVNIPHFPMEKVI